MSFYSTLDFSGIILLWINQRLVQKTKKQTNNNKVNDCSYSFYLENVSNAGFRCYYSITVRRKKKRGRSYLPTFPSPPSCYKLDVNGNKGKAIRLFNLWL